MKELPNGPLQCLTRAGGHEPAWIAGGDSLVYNAISSAPLMRRIARNGNAPPGDSVLRLQGQGITGMKFTPDGRFAAFGHFEIGNGPGSMRIGTLDLSPDGRFLAYASSESGLNHVYVRPFPDLGAGHVQVSVGNSGSEPIWSRGTKELFDIQRSGDGSGQMTVAEYSTANGFRVVNRRPLFPIRAMRLRKGQTSQPYDVTRDGQRFGTVRPAPSRAVGTEERLVLVRNWFTELERMVGGR